MVHTLKFVDVPELEGMVFEVEWVIPDESDDSVPPSYIEYAVVVSDDNRDSLGKVFGIADDESDRECVFPQVLLDETTLMKVYTYSHVTRETADELEIPEFSVGLKPV